MTLGDRLKRLGERFRSGLERAGAKIKGVLVKAGEVIKKNWKTIVGGALVVVGALTSWAGVGGALVTAGAGLIVGGVSEAAARAAKKAGASADTARKIENGTAVVSGLLISSAGANGAQGSRDGAAIVRDLSKRMAA